MRTIKINANDKTYNCVVGKGLLKNLRDHFPAPAFEDAHVLIVADENTAPLYAPLVKQGLLDLGYRVSEVVLPAGETNKNTTSLQLIYEAAFNAGLGRRDFMLALGGGVVGDLTGFAAATYMRGIDYIQVPTTVLAQVDSSVGGKTGIDTHYGKNLIGAFKQPYLVLADTDTLETLPFIQLASGMAEVIKYALLAGEERFSELEGMQQVCPSEELIALCIEQKASVVASDAEEQGIRAWLNLGHSFGHAIEKASGYARYTHGEAVALGMLCALRIGEQLAFTPKSLLPRLQILLQRWSLPVYTDIPLSDILPLLTADKKRLGQGLNFILLEDWGKPLIYWLSDDLLRGLAECLQGYCVGVPDRQPEKLRVRPGFISGEVYPPPSKSQAHRLLLCAALSEKDSPSNFTRFISNFAEASSDDVLATTKAIGSMLRALAASGPAAAADAGSAAASSEPSAADADAIEIDCGESGSTVRFLIPIAAALGLKTRFVGHGRLPLRPLDAYREALEPHGVKLTFPDEPGHYLPLTVEGRLRPGLFRIAGDSSSQYITGMLMAMCLLDEPSTLQLTTRLESAPYVDLTLQTLRLFGQKVEEAWQEGQLSYCVRPDGGFKKPSGSLEIERDYSQAAFWYLAAFVGHDIKVRGLRENSLQGDRAIEKCLRDMAARRDSQDFGAAVEIDVSQFPDLFPALGVASALAGEGRVTRLVNASRLRIKESDRLSATADLLSRLGVPCVTGDDYLEVTGVSHFRAAELDSYGDHRLAMAGAIAALSADGPCVILRAGAIAKSYPAFYRELRRLGALAEAL